MMPATGQSDKTPAELAKKFDIRVRSANTTVGGGITCWSSVLGGDGSGIHSCFFRDLSSRTDFEAKSASPTYLPRRR